MKNVLLFLFLVNDLPYLSSQQIEYQKGDCDFNSSAIHIPITHHPTTQAADTFPLTELGLGTWKNYPGGLYPNGKNIRPHDHDSAGIEMAKTIRPLNAQGIEDKTNGKIVLLSIGMSNATQEYSAFKILADTFRLKNPQLIVIDGAQGGQTASVIKDGNANFWNVVNQRLTTQNLSPLQVQSVWLKEANANPNAAFPKHAQDLKSDIKIILGLLKSKFPNLRLVYLASRIYGGYANTTLNPEPYAYESGFSIKWLIEEQINGDTSLQYAGNNPKVPWISWGPYLWAKGNTPRSDGLVWLPADFATDGTHPSNSGRLKVARLLLQFFSTDSSAIPWFLDAKVTTSLTDFTEKDTSPPLSLYQNFPNPFYSSTTISFETNKAAKTTLKITDLVGRHILHVTDENMPAGYHEYILQNQGIPPGMYYYTLQIENYTVCKKLWKR